jgi:hypothetical protein
LYSVQLKSVIVYFAYFKRLDPETYSHRGREAGEPVRRLEEECKFKKVVENTNMTD